METTTPLQQPTAHGKRSGAARRKLRKERQAQLDARFANLEIDPEKGPKLPPELGTTSSTSLRTTRLPPTPLSPELSNAAPSSVRPRSSVGSGGTRRRSYSGRRSLFILTKLPALLSSAPTRDTRLEPSTFGPSSTICPRLKGS
ncbi:hypothetical protein BCR35DRAFT_222690 [Leucosporidium creatinivorum]|uniref:Uncharacterized protein n=1 Tax=Leucosporidium creatinivorum TaxID=106004 RepID=A0A1Y2D7R8_9BASI|nr:hypothetical protein BCR35DRAFT_222690 [Leucosporidium creatinivorum]